MIKARDLRIGNLVKCVRHLPIGFHAPTLSYSEIVEIREGSIELSEGVYKFRNINPLKLTEQVLINSGGVKGENNQITFETHKSHYPVLTLVEESGFYYLSDGNGNKLGVHFDSVHHFQNLYYILVGSEISIKMEM